MKFGARLDLDEEATRWVVRLHSDQVTRDDQKAFTAWLAETSANSKSYNELARLWTAIAALRENENALAALQPLRRADAYKAWRRRMLATSVACCALAIASGLTVWRTLDTRSHAHAQTQVAHAAQLRAP